MIERFVIPICNYQERQKWWELESKHTRLDLQQEVVTHISFHIYYSYHLADHRHSSHERTCNRCSYSLKRSRQDPWEAGYPFA